MSDTSWVPLRDRPALAVTVVLVLYVLTEVVSDVLVLALFPDAPRAMVLGKLIAFSLFAFVVIPRVLALPDGRVGPGVYLESIGLRTIHPFGLILLVTLSCYALFVASQLAGSWIYHASRTSDFVLDFSRHGLFDQRSVIAGIFEEIVLRGVLVTILLRHYSQRRAVLVSAAAFAGLHLLNILNPELNTIWVLGQAVWAFALGVLYAHVFTTFRSLYPLILIHYLLNSLVGVWFRGPDTQDAVSALYGIPFFGVVPALLAIVWVRFLSRSWTDRDAAPAIPLKGPAASGESA